MKVMKYLSLLMLLLCSISTWGQDGFDPTNPPEPPEPPTKPTVLTLVADPVDGGSVGGAGAYRPGTEVKLTASPATGFQFVNWTRDGVEISTERDFTYTKGDNDETLVAHFVYRPGDPTEPNEPDIKPVAKKYKLTVVAEEGGTGVKGSGEYESGTKVELSVSVSTGYLLKGWYNEADSLLSTATRFTYTTLERDEVITARIEYTPNNPAEPDEPNLPERLKPHNITVLAVPSDGGSVSTEQSSVVEGQQTRVRASANNGFVFDGWYVADTLFQTAADFYYTMGKKDIVMEGRFSYSPGDPAEPGEAGKKSYTFYLTSVRGLPGRTVQYPVYLSSLDSLTNMQFNITFPAGLTPDIENVKLSGKAQGYALTVQEVAVTEEPTSGAPRRAAASATAYQFSLTGGKLPACNTRLMTIDVSIDENVQDTTQQVKINQVTVTDTEGANTTASTRNGNVVMNESSGDGTYYYLTLISTGSGQASVNSRAVRNSLHIFDLLEGSSTNVYFTPDNGYHIEKVLLDEVDITEQVRQNSRYLFSNVHADATLTVQFAEGASNAYDLTVKATGQGVVDYNGVVVRDGEQVFSVSHGAQAELAIIPDDGYHIAKVLLNDTTDVTAYAADSLYVIESMTSANSISVTFEQNPKVENVELVQNGNRISMSTATEGAVIHYTQTGVDGEQTYTETLTLTDDCTLRAWATLEGYNTSDTTQLAFVKADVTVATPVLARNNNKVGISCSTEQAVIHYTMDGSAPTAASQVYADSIVVNQNCTIKAIALRENWFDSAVDSLIVDLFKVQSVVFVQDGNRISMSTATENATIHYTQTGVDGEQTYTAPLNLTGDCTIEAWATREGYSNSDTTRYEFIYTPVGEALFDGQVAMVSGERTLDDAFESVGGRVEAAKTITAIIWEKETALTEADLQGLDNPNLLLFVNSKEQAASNMRNLVVNGEAQNITLTDNSSGNCDFYSPRDFRVKHIQYTREFRQQTQIGVGRGWESIALPFTVQTITHERQGVISPFGIDGNGKHFWLRMLSPTGLTRATQIEANRPYVISMPNSDEYKGDDYYLNGRVTFAADDAVVPATTLRATALADSSIVMMPALQQKNRSSEVWALNVGQVRGQYLEGSVFERDYREVRPFEAYTVHRGTSAPRFLPILEIEDGNMTGIEVVDSGRQEPDVWYSLDGRKLQQKPSRKGVYILNGRRVALKFVK